MARLAGVDLPPGKRAEIGLTYIYGIGRTRAKSLLHRCGISFDKKIRDLSEDEVNHIRTILEEEGAVEGDRVRTHAGERKIGANVRPALLAHPLPFFRGFAKQGSQRCCERRRIARQD